VAATPLSEVIVVDSPARLARTAAEWVVVRLRDVAARNRVTFALSGGSTPRLLYQSLATEMAHRVPWERIEFYFGDERCVPPSDADSNYRLAEEALFRGHLVDGGKVHRMAGEDPDPEAAAAEYGVELPPALDLLLLGVGPDGHTCSLFPGQPALDEKVRRVVVVKNAPKPPSLRLTITPPVIAAARGVLVLCAGRDKAAAVAAALEGPLDIHACPAQLARHGTWILDRAAAARLSSATSQRKM
jgi:6-phosphogluconolactonase